MGHFLLPLQQTGMSYWEKKTRNFVIVRFPELDSKDSTGSRYNDKLSSP